MNLKDYELNLYNTLKNKNVELTDVQLSQFQKYADLLREWNEKMNLTAITEMHEIYIKHFLDCVLPSFSVEMKGSLCDVGAGAGFPSIPLKIVYPHLHVTIVEPLQKRCTFLKHLVKELGLENVTIENKRSEDFAKEARESFDIVSGRAVANLTMLSELCVPLVKKDGIFLAMKGASGKEELEQAKYALNVLGCTLDHIDEYELDEAKRINLVFNKTKKTPPKYPRQFAKIKKEPLLGNKK